ncbi:hypothetical protein M0R04_04535 [Candidatus Dojkabacteria bacterium]|jgi:hypothetical protein|nr:hypothetical protein [Candidatus Dojkabacteria bacterium]
MKIRKGFVSNSSSSSFICDVCGFVESGYDMSLYDAEMYQCENGHTFCNKHMVLASEYDMKCDDDEIVDSRYEVPSKYCPICSISSVSSDDMLAYLLKKNNTNKDKVTSEIRVEFGSYEEFSEFIKK